RARQGAVVLPQLVADQRLVQVDVAVDKGGEDELARAVDPFLQPGRGARAHAQDRLAVDHDVDGRAAGQTGLLQSPHEGLNLAPGPGVSGASGGVGQCRSQQALASGTSSIPRTGWRGRKRSSWACSM